MLPGRKSKLHARIAPEPARTRSLESDYPSTPSKSRGNRRSATFVCMVLFTCCILGAAFVTEGMRGVVVSGTSLSMFPRKVLQFPRISSEAAPVPPLATQMNPVGGRVGPETNGTSSNDGGEEADGVAGSAPPTPGIDSAGSGIASSNDSTDNGAGLLQERPPTPSQQMGDQGTVPVAGIPRVGGLLTPVPGTSTTTSTTPTVTSTPSPPSGSTTTTSAPAFDQPSTPPQQDQGEEQGTADDWWTEPDMVSAGALLRRSSNSTLHLPRASTAIEDITHLGSSASKAALPECKIHVLDPSSELADAIGLPRCDLADPAVWPFNQAGAGIDGSDALAPLDFQYSQEAWLASAIRNSSHAARDAASADFVLLDLHCLHLSWLAYNHPFGKKSAASAAREDPAPAIWRAVEAVLDLPRFRVTKGAAFAMLSPTPSLQRFFPEDDVCEELGGVLHLVPEAANLCIWTRSSRVDNALIVPYVASTDLALDGEGSDAVILAEKGKRRPLHVFFVGGCGNPAEEVRRLFAAGKMLRYELVQALNSEEERARSVEQQTVSSSGDGATPAISATTTDTPSTTVHPLATNGKDVLAKCACDICEGHLSHAQYMAAMRQSTFCPIVASNAQSSRRLAEAILSGCIPVFLGAPFHTVPLAGNVDYNSIALFIRIQNTSAWVDAGAPRWDQNRLAETVWALDASVDENVVNVATLQEALQYLRSVPESTIAAKRAALVRERYKFYYPPVPASAGIQTDSGSVLGDIVIQKMCERASIARQAMSTGIARAIEEERALPGIAAAAGDMVSSGGAAAAENASIQQEQHEEGQESQVSHSDGTSSGATVATTSTVGTVPALVQEVPAGNQVGSAANNPAAGETTAVQAATSLSTSGGAVEEQPIMMQQQESGESIANVGATTTATAVVSEAATAGTPAAVVGGQLAVTAQAQEGAGVSSDTQQQGSVSATTASSMGQVQPSTTDSGTAVQQAGSALPVTATTR